ncbi:MAG: bacillithiol system redox-active protein YtxJ [Flavobacteriaceae bacterium]
MSFLNKIFSSDKTPQEPKKEIPWKPLTSVSEVDEIVKTSKTKPVAIFKHSTSCGISRMVLKQFERDYDIEEGTMGLYYLDLLSYRNVSNEVAARFQVMHQSPQLLVIKNGAAVYNASHHSIQAAELEKL